MPQPIKIMNAELDEVYTEFARQEAEIGRQEAEVTELIDRLAKARAQHAASTLNLRRHIGPCDRHGHVPVHPSPSRW